MRESVNGLRNELVRRLITASNNIARSRIGESDARRPRFGARKIRFSESLRDEFRASFTT